MKQGEGPRERWRMLSAGAIRGDSDRGGGSLASGRGFGYNF